MHTEGSDALIGSSSREEQHEYTRIKDYIEYLKSLVMKWLPKWESMRVYEADPAEGVPKFFVTVAFMYPNGPAHIGHARTYVIPDVLARFKRLMGYNVLFPMGFHYTGTPILSTASRIASGDEDFIRRFAGAFAIPAEDLRKLNEPLKLARYFHRLSKRAMRLYGLSIDWRREFTTVDPEFKKFIVWQFKKLKNLGYLTRGSHPVGWCPRDGMPVGMHDTKDDVEPEIGEVTVIKFQGTSDGLTYPAATLRPETALGVTNVWVNPNIMYCISLVGSNGKQEKWVLACRAAQRLSYQMEVKVLETVRGSDLIGRSVVNPLTGNEVPILPAEFVTPNFGTGVVMSVPAHAPYDYVALKEYASRVTEVGSLKPIPLIRVKGYGAIPAADVVTKLGIKSQLNSEALDRATKEVYRAEFTSGIMRDDLQNLVVREIIRGVRKFIKESVCGKPVSEARETIKEFLIRHGYATRIYELMNAPVYCRCGAEVVVKLLKNQWFLDYGNPRWKAKAKELLAGMRVIPERARNEFLAVIDWLKARACARSRGLGTEIPWEKGWIIESLSDSTIYMAFYTVIHKIREFGIPAGKLTESFWDYVMLGRGDEACISRELSISIDDLQSLRKEFEYWYPLDSRHSGKDLIPSHLTFFIFNHAAIFPKEKWPRQIVANGWVLVRGEKMAKSKGNTRVLHSIIDMFSPDIVRLAMTLSAEVDADLNFTEELISSLADQLRRIEKLIKNLHSSSVSDRYGLPEKWILSRLSLHILNVMDELEDVRVRGAGVRIFYLIPQDLSEYLRIIGDNRPSKLLRPLLMEWLKLISMYTPFFAEEIWHCVGNKSLVVAERLKSRDELLSHVDKEALLKVEFVRRLVKDIKELLRVVGPKRHAVIYVAPRASYAYLLRVSDVLSKGGDVREVFRIVASAPEFKGGNVRRVARALVDLASAIDNTLLKYLKDIEGIDEFGTIEEMREYIEREVGIKLKAIYRADDANAPDLGGKKRAALPWRPGVYLE